MVFPPIAKEGAYLGSDRLIPEMVLSLQCLLVPLSTLLESARSSPFAIGSFEERLNRNWVREGQNRQAKLRGCIRDYIAVKLWRDVSAVVSAVRRFGATERVE